MKVKLTLLLFFAVFLIKVDAGYSQNMWNKQKVASATIQKKEIYYRKNIPSEYQIISLDKNAFENRLKSSNKGSHIIELPKADGSLEKFSIRETSNFEAGLQAKFPNIKSYSAQGIDDPTAIAKISIGTDGFHAVIFSGNAETVYVDPYTRNKKEHIVYSRGSLNKVERDFKCEVEETVSLNEEFKISDFSRKANDGKLRIYRLALACSAEYAEFHLGAGQQNIPDSASEEVKKAAVLSAMNTSITRVNGIFEKDVAVKLVLVTDNDKLIFFDEDTDGITDGSPSTMINEVQAICDSEIGDENYDIGHLFSTGGDGLAGFGVVCVTGRKARGVTGRREPVGDPYDIDFVIHEFGHQFGATHTQNSDCNRTNSTAVEPGSGSTIMGYAGICVPNVQSGNPNGNSDDYFHAISLTQMWDYIQTRATCALETDTNNAAPTADAGLDYSIPKSTPFKLTGTATDADGLSSLTYNWEQQDNEVATMPPLSTNAEGPAFRSLPSKISPIRFMPDLTTVILGSISSTWEVVPSVARELNFSFLVRDNNAGGGSYDRSDMKVTVTEAEAFTVSSPNTALTWDVGTTQTITWVKGTTDIAPVNCSAVNIKLSLDGGVTFPITLKSNTLNDGTEDIVVPNNATTNARIMVEAADNIFYNLNTSNFIINSTIPTFLISADMDSKAVCNSGNKTVDYNLNFDFVNGFSDTVTLSASGFPSNANVTFSPSTINADGTVVMTLSNLDGETQQDYQIVVMGNSSSLNQEIVVSLKVVSSDFNEIVLLSPEDNLEDFELDGILSWQADVNAVSYNVEVSLDSDFSSFVFSENVTDNSVRITSILDQETRYFWRVQPVNNCNIGNFNEPFSFVTLSCDVCESFGSVEFATSTTSVKFNTIDNSTAGKEEDTGGYSDFTAIETELDKEETYELSVSVNTDGNFRVQTKAWIDWNKDCLFDDSEEYDLGSAANGENVLTSESPFLIKVPENAKAGTTTLRISTKYTDPDDIEFPFSCERDYDGEVEDYSVSVKGVFIEDAAFEDFNLYPNPTNGKVKLSFATKSRNDVTVQLYNILGTLIETKNFNNSSTFFTRDITFNVSSGGMYLLRIYNGDKFTTRRLLINLY